MPRRKFVKEPTQEYQGMEVEFSHWFSAEALKPLARLRVGPEDFPFLEQIRGHDDEKLFERVKADPGGFPWLDE